MHSVGRASTGSPVKSCSTVTGIAVQLRVPGQGHKTACYGLTVLVCFFQIKPPHRFHLLFLQDECLDIDRLLIDIDKGNFVVPEDFSVKFFCKISVNASGKCKILRFGVDASSPQAPAGRMQVVHRLPEYDRRKTYRIFREKNLYSLRVFCIRT